MWQQGVPGLHDPRGLEGVAELGGDQGLNYFGRFFQSITHT